MKSFSFPAGETPKAFSKTLKTTVSKRLYKDNQPHQVHFNNVFLKGSVSLGFKSNDAPWIGGGKTYSRFRGSNLHQVTKPYNPLH